MHGTITMTKPLLPALREAVRQAVYTLNSMRDPDAHFLRQGARYATVGDAALAYGYNAASVSMAPPSPSEITRMEIVLDWLGWLRRTKGTDDFRRVMDWANGMPVFTISLREKCSRRTVMNRIDRSLNAILAEFGDCAEDVGVIDEPMSADLPPPFFITEIPSNTGAISNFGNPIADNRQIIVGKIYIAGVGFMKNGRPLRDGSYRAERV